MSSAKATIGNNAYIGAFCLATDSFSLITRNSTNTERSIIEEVLNVKTVQISVDGSSLVGVYAVANSKGIILPESMDEREMDAMKKALPNVRIETMRTGLNALRNNILTNDKIAFVNHEYGDAEVKKIADVLDVEVIKTRIGLFETVGANNILTNKGIVLNNGATDEEIALIRRKIPSVSQSTANLGSPSIGLCAVANSNGVVLGSQTTGFEITRITEGLDL